MQYFISFLEGVITFISPCLLPMLPVYVSYFAAGGEKRSRRTLVNALGFVLGFTLVFLAMGALAGTLGSFLRRYEAAVNLVSGAIVVLLGLGFMGVFELKLFRPSRRSVKKDNMDFASALLFGLAFSVGWTPCVGTFLGSALLLASQQGHVLEGVVMLLCYSLGLGIPFVLSAVLIDYLKGAFGFIKRHYRAVNLVCGALLVLVGIAMATGLLGRLLAVLS